MKKDIFISYRRNGGEWLAYCIYLRLIEAGYSVFFDIESLRGGTFEDDILEQIEACKDFILILPPGALDRCIDSQDLVYKEIKAAKENKKNIIPIVMKNFSLPPIQVYKKNEMQNRYELLKGIVEKKNGYVIDSIIHYEGMLLQLQTHLLQSHSRGIHKKDDTVTLDQMFKDYPINKKKNLKYELIPNISTCEYFVEGSRNQEIAWLSDTIERQQPVFVWGYGGIGKTELMQEFSQYQSKIRNVAFTTFSNSIRETIIQMKFAGYVMPELEQLSEEKRRVVEQKIYQEKLKLLNEYSEKDILIIDNFEKEGKTLTELKQEDAYRDIIGIHMHVIFTTRNRPDTITPEVQPLKEKDLLKMMKHYLGDKIISDDILLQLIKAVDSHTMSVELIAKLLADEFSCITAQQILEAFSKGKVKELDDTEIESSKDRIYRETTIFEHIHILFNIEKLSDLEKIVLRHAFFISEIGIKTDVFIQVGKEHLELCHIDNAEQYKKTVRSLVKKGWFRIKGKTLFLHTLVKEVMREEGLIILDEELSEYFLECSDRRYNHLSEQTYIAWEKWRNVQYMRAKYMVNAFKQFHQTNAFFATKAAIAFEDSLDMEQTILYSNIALDIILAKGKEKMTYCEKIAMMELEELWCPKMVESKWNEDSYYGNELYEDHSNKSPNIQNIYNKILLFHKQLL